MIIANPIYDIVFKYLMEDERIARTILSALLKMEIVAVEVRPHEYANDQRDSLSVFRIDFGATVRNADGSEQLILVELQKTWLETETLRFRQYLGVHYSNPKNMSGDHALPTVAVYLLGHKVGDIEEPVLYVHHQSFDYNGNLVTKGIPNAFVDSLTHDSIIVQIPRLHGQINNRLDKVLSIFDQTRKDKFNEHMLQLDETVYSDDREMERILHRLTMAAADADMRHSMNVEDEYFSAIERRDTELMLKDKELAEKSVQLAEKSVLLAEKDDQLAEKDGQLTEKDKELAEKENQLAEKDGQLTEKNKELAEKENQLAAKDGQLTEKDKELAEKENQLAAKDGQLTEKDKELAEKENQLAAKDGQLTEKDKELAEKENQLAAKDSRLGELLRSSVLSLHKAGLSQESVAAALGIDRELVGAILAS